MKKGFAIAFFVLSIISCVMMVGKPWSLFEELLVDTVTNASDDEDIAEIQNRIYELGGTEWVYVYKIGDSLEINVEARDYDPELFPDFVEYIRDEVMAILEDVTGTDALGSLYISQVNSVTEETLSWYSTDGTKGYFSYLYDSEETSFNNVTPQELDEIIGELTGDLFAMGGALG